MPQKYLWKEIHRGKEVETEVAIREDSEYGYFSREHNKGYFYSEGGLWFEKNEEGKTVLTDYDGVYCLPEDVINILLKHGVVVEDMFYPDYIGDEDR